MELNLTELYQKRIDSLTARTNCHIVQLNGQRIYGPPTDWRGEPPVTGSEVFFGKLPRFIFEDELVPLFERIGPLYQLRLMMDFSGKNRGYGFVTFTNPKDAAMAVSFLHGVEIRPNQRIGVYKSVNNCRLFIGGIPIDKTSDEIKSTLDESIDGVVKVIMYQAYFNKKHNRGFVFVEFESHRHAAMARRNLHPGTLVLWGASIVVDWADPLPEVDPCVMSKVTKLHVRNLNVDKTSNDFRNFLLEHMRLENIVRIYKTMDYAFVHFVNRSEAEKAFDILQGKPFFDNAVYVSWARPKIYSKQCRMNNPPLNFCRSLPPRMRKQLELTTNTSSWTSFDEDRISSLYFNTNDYYMHLLNLNLERDRGYCPAASSFLRFRGLMK